MSRWIDADALIRYGKRGTLVYWEDIENAPSIDLVTCAECKHWAKSSFAGEYFCGCLEGGIGGSADDFCSYGERKESE